MSGEEEPKDLKLTPVTPFETYELLYSMSGRTVYLLVLEDSEPFDVKDGKNTPRILLKGVLVPHEDRNLFMVEDEGGNSFGIFRTNMVVGVIYDQNRTTINVTYEAPNKE